MTMRWPGIEPGSTAWKAAMLTTIPPTLNRLCDMWNLNIKTFKKNLNFTTLFGFTKVYRSERKYFLHSSMKILTFLFCRSAIFNQY